MLFLFMHGASAQEKGAEIQLFFKDAKSPVSATFKQFKKADNQLVVRFNDKLKRIHIKKLDSVFTTTDTLVVKRVNGRPWLLNPLTRGTLSLYEYDGKRLYIQKENDAVYVVPRSRLGKFYHYYTQPAQARIYPELEKEEFIERIRSFNASPDAQRAVLYDSLRTASPLLVFRVGIVLPSLGFELGLSPRITFANGISTNLFGPTFRDAQTIVNFASHHQLRYFIGYHKRLEKGKSNFSYNGIYTAPSVQILYDIGRTPIPIYGWSVGWQEDILFNKAYNTTYIGIGLDRNLGGLWIFTGYNLGLAF